MCTLLQSMMLLDNRYADYEFSSISADEIMRYASCIKNNYSEKQKERLYDIIDYLEKVFPEKDKMLKKINIPIVMLTADTAMGNDYDSAKSIYQVGPMYFRQWFSYFFDECYEDYKQYCSSGSIKKEKTLKRIEVMEQSFRKYFELEEDASSNEAFLPDDSSSLKDADFVENNSQTNNGTSISDLQEGFRYSSVAEAAASYDTSGQTKAADINEKEQLPEKAEQKTE